MNRPIVIIGFMGAGKTTVGRELAQRMGRKFVDLDESIVEDQGRSIAALIRSVGEAGFREIESHALPEMLKDGKPGVIALGGGTWCFAANRAAITAAGAVSVWLDAPFEVCWQRICESAEERPLARNEGATRALFDARRSDYELTEIRIESNTAHSVDEIVAAITERIEPGVPTNG